MFFIFGFGYTTTYDYEIKTETQCRKCGNYVRLHLTKITKWFTLFFIPLIPYDKKYFICCPACSDETPLNKDNFNEIKNNPVNYVP